MGELKLEAGKRYVRSDGQVTGKMCKKLHAEFYPFYDEVSRETYTEFGIFSMDGDSRSDIVAEYIEGDARENPEANMEWIDELTKGKSIPDMLEAIRELEVKIKEREELLEQGIKTFENSIRSSKLELEALHEDPMKIKYGGTSNQEL